MKTNTFSCLSVLCLWMSFGSGAALEEPKICYILDSILFVYGFILTILYCRLKLQVKHDDAKRSANSEKKAETDGIYEGLVPHAPGTYETITMKKGKQ